MSHFQMSVDDSDQAMSSSTESNHNNHHNNNNNNSKKTNHDISKVKKETSTKSVPNKKIESLSTRNADGDGEKTETESEMSPSSRLVTVDCTLCGKQFGRNSINFHTRQCQRKQQEQSLLKTF